MDTQSIHWCLMMQLMTLLPIDVKMMQDRSVAEYARPCPHPHAIKCCVWSQLPLRLRQGQCSCVRRSCQRRRMAACWSRINQWKTQL
jgi:hypothetical protein